MHNLVGDSIRSLRGVNYRILQWLGSGGNSVVYLVIALNGHFRGVLFALKIFTRLSSSGRLERFQQEIVFLSGCDHPSIMRIFDSGIYSERDGTDYPFVVVEYLPKTMHDIIRGATTTVERISYTLQLLSALAYLDQQDPPVVHRDIKPQNIFLKGKSCVLGDFGLMKFLDSEDKIDREIYKDSTVPGMPFFYRTPDLVAYARQESPLTTKSDVFQLGLVVAQLFTGWNPERKAEDFLAPVELDSVGYIPGAKHATIRELIESMLDLDPETRPAAIDLIDPWDGVFREVTDQCHRLDGRIF